jgi:UDP-N-acetylglucosamine 2-epimerase (non-hydrolysing)
LTLRENTERPETIEVGGNILVGTDFDLIQKNLTELLTNKEIYKKMAASKNPFGDGSTSIKVLQIIKDTYNSGKLKINSLSTINSIPTVRLIKLNSNELNITVQDYERKHNCVIEEIFDVNGESIFPRQDCILLFDYQIKVLFL